jgi:hypothetical protein
MDRVTFFELHGPLLVHGVAEDVEDATENALADRDGDGGAGILDGEAAFEAFAGAHGDGTNPSLTEVLLDLEHEATGGRLDLEGVVDGGNSAVGELDVHDGSDNLGDASFVHREREK